MKAIVNKAKCWDRDRIYADYLNDVEKSLRILLYQNITKMLLTRPISSYLTLPQEINKMLIDISDTKY